MVNKRVGLGLSVFTGIIAFMSFASAQWYGNFGTSSVVQSVINFYKAFFEPIFQVLLGEYSGSEFFFIKILLLILLFLIIDTILKKLPLKLSGMVSAVVAFLISLIAMRFMPSSYIAGWIQISYTALGVALTTVLPFMIYVIFVHTAVESPLGRKTALGFYFVVLTAIFVSKYSGLDSVSRYIYWGTLTVTVVIILFDEYIRKYYGLLRYSKFMKSVSQEEAARLQARYVEIMSVNTPEAKATRKKIADRLKELGAEVPGR